MIRTAVILLFATATIANAQAPDVIKGKIIDDSSHAVAGASVQITRGPDRLTQSTTSDASGSYSAKFEQGTGDYLVYVSAAGFKSARRRVQRQNNETELVANFTLAHAVNELE